MWKMAQVENTRTQYKIGELEQQSREKMRFEDRGCGACGGALSCRFASLERTHFVRAWHYESVQWKSCDSVPVWDRGFRYGMSVFETVAICAGRPVFWEEHLGRLGSAALAMGWQEIVPPSSPPNGEGMLEATGVLRVYLTAGPGFAGDPFYGSIYALFEECEVGAGFSAARIASSPAMYLPSRGGWKTGNYWQNVDAVLSAKQHNLDDVLLFNPSGCLVCMSMANIFLEIGGVWKTPALETGARDGVVRAWVASQIPVEDALIGADEVARCTACFATNSRVGVRAVCELDGRSLETNVTGLQRLYQRQVAGILSEEWFPPK